MEAHRVSLPPARIQLIGCAILALAAVTGCSETPEPPATHAGLWPEADALFHGDARWIGGDGAYSVDLHDGRVLWLFGDSFIAATRSRVRAQSRMIRNSVAIQTGYDPSNALLRFYWRLDEDGEPASFVAETTDSWFWPEHGVRLETGLLLFYEELVTPVSDPEGFETSSWTALRVPSPELEPTLWEFRPVRLPVDTYGVVLGEAAMVREDWLYVYGTGGRTHDIYLARYPLSMAASGDLSDPTWWTEDGWAGSAPDPVVALGQPEFSVHFDDEVGLFVMVFTEGYGATTLALRVARSPEGPWSSPHDIVRPPESFADDAFVYAGKAHPELLGASLVATYVPSRFHDMPSVWEERLYYPRFVRITF